MKLVNESLNDVLKPKSKEKKASKNYDTSLPSIEKIKKLPSFDWHVNGSNGPSYLSREGKINPYLISLNRFILKNT